MARTAFYIIRAWGLGVAPRDVSFVECEPCHSHTLKTILPCEVVAATHAHHQPHNRARPGGYQRQGGRVAALRISAWHPSSRITEESGKAWLGIAPENRIRLIRRSRSQNGSASSTAANRVFQKLSNLKTYAPKRAAASISPHKNPILYAQPLFW